MLNLHHLIIQQHQHFSPRCFVSLIIQNQNNFFFFILIFLEQTKESTQQQPLSTIPTDSLIPSIKQNSHRSPLRDTIHTLQKHSNSCSTIYVDDSTVSQPNWKAMIKCVSIAIHSHICHRKSNKTMSIFDEKLHPVTVKKNLIFKIFFIFIFLKF
jgi:hypothetical protein